jgi:hypothetical protein
MRFDPIIRLQRSKTLALILSPVGVLIVAAARLLIIAGYSTSTASAIVTSDGYVNVLLGSVIPVIQILMPYVALVLLFFRRFLPGALALIIAGLISPSPLDSHEALSIASRDLHRIASLSLSDLWIIPVAVVAAIPLLAVLVLGMNAFVRTVGTLLALALTVYVVGVYPLQTGRSYYQNLLTLPWIPAQEITLISGKTEIGFVISDSDISTEVLLNNTRSVVYYPNQMIKHQELCDIDPEVEQGPLIRLIPAKATTPPCSVPATAAKPARPAKPPKHSALPATPVHPPLPVTG